MVKFILDQTNKSILEKFVDDMNGKIYGENVKIVLKIYSPDFFNLLNAHTNLSSVLINVVGEYITDDVVVHITRKIVGLKGHYMSCDDNNQKLHVDFEFCVDNANINFNTYSFLIICCIFYNCARSWQLNKDHFATRYNETPNMSIYNSSLIFHTLDDDVLERELYLIDKQFDTECYRSGITFNRFQYGIRHTFLQKYSENPEKYITVLQAPESHKKIDEERFDLNTFFNCYSENVGQRCSIKCDDTPAILKADKRTKWELIIEKCKYDNKTNCYKHISVRSKNPGMIQYKIKNKKKLDCIIAINKLLYETVNEQAKSLCKDQAKIKEIINDYQKSHTALERHYRYYGYDYDFIYRSYV